MFVFPLEKTILRCFQFLLTLFRYDDLTFPSEYLNNITGICRHVLSLLATGLSAFYIKTEQSNVICGIKQEKISDSFE